MKFLVVVTPPSIYHKETLSVYDIKGKENTLSTSENKENAHDGYVHIYECVKKLLDLTYEHVCTAQETTISKMKDIVDIYNSYIKEISSTKWYMWEYIDSCHMESERRAAYLEPSNAHFVNVVNITVDGASVFPQEKQNWSEKDHQENPYDEK